MLSLSKAFYNYKPCCDKKSNTVGSLILWETESPIRAKHNTDQRHLLWKTVMMLEWIITSPLILKYNKCVVIYVLYKWSKVFLSIIISIKFAINYYNWDSGNYDKYAQQYRWRGASKCLCLEIWKFPSRRPRCFTTGESFVINQQSIKCFV